MQWTLVNPFPCKTCMRLLKRISFSSPFTMNVKNIGQCILLNGIFFHLKLPDCYRKSAQHCIWNKVIRIAHSTYCTSWIFYYCIRHETNRVKMCPCLDSNQGHRHTAPTLLYKTRNQLNKKVSRPQFEPGSFSLCWFQALNSKKISNYTFN